MRIAIENSIDCSAVVGATEGLKSTVRLVGDWKANNTGDTFDGSFVVNYVAYNADGDPFPGTYTTTWLVGVNSFSFNEPHTGESLLVTGTLNLCDIAEITNTPDEWFWDLMNVQAEFTISGGVYTNTSPGTREYVGIRLPEAGEYGDYSFSGEHVDPNGAVTQATNNGAILARWTPKLFTNSYRVDGVTWIDAVEPPISVAGYELIDVEYYPGADYMLDGIGNLLYDPDGKIGFIPGALPAVQVTGLAFNPGDNSIIPPAVADSAGVENSVEGFEVTRIPDVQYTKRTTFSEEEDGRIVTVIDGLLVDQGLTNESNEDVTFNFTGDDYGAVNKPACYSYPTGEEGCVDGGVNLTYNQGGQVEPPNTDDVVQFIEGDGDIINILTYNDLTEIGEAQEGIQYTSTIDVDEGFGSATTFQYVMNFTSGDYRNYIFNIPHTNPITLEVFSIEVTIDYVASATPPNPVLEAINNYTFGTPKYSPDSTRTLRVDGPDTYVVDVEDQLFVGDTFGQATEANQPEYVTNSKGHAGIQLVSVDANLKKQLSGNEKWSGTLFTLVFEFMGASTANSDFDTILYAGFTSRPLIFKSTRQPYAKDGGNETVATGNSFDETEFGVCAICCDTAQNTMTLRDSKGGIVSTGFDGFGLDGTQRIGSPPGLDWNFMGIVHRMYVLPTCADATKFNDIVTQGIADYWED